MDEISIGYLSDMKKEFLTQTISPYMTILHKAIVHTTLQTLTGKLQGRISTQGDPCSHYRE